MVSSIDTFRNDTIPYDTGIDTRYRVFFPSLVGAIIASVSRNVTLLLLGRSVQGAGAGTLLTMTFVVLTDLVSLRERGKWTGLISLVWLVGAVTGPVIEGVFSQKVTWVCDIPPPTMSQLILTLAAALDLLGLLPIQCDKFCFSDLVSSSW
jgi:MFS family permease